MIGVTQLAQYLLKLDPPKDPGRLAFYHYLKNWNRPADPVGPQMVEEFLERCLGYDFWNQSPKALTECVLMDLQGFLKPPIATWDLNFLKKWFSPQTVNIENYDDFKEIVLNEMESTKKAGDQFKIIQINEKTLMSLRLEASGGLVVKTFKNLVRIEGGRLKLLAPFTHLRYGPGLELSPLERQVLEGPLLSTFVFEMGERGATGLLSRGHSFQKMESFSAQNLNQNPELFYALKRVERHFVQPQSDPFYQELINLLEKAYHQINTGNLDAVPLAEVALQKGKLALRNIFPNDKLLLLLVSNIEYWLTSQSTSSARSTAPANHII